MMAIRRAVLIGIAGITQAWSLDITGKVIDKTSAPIAGARVCYEAVPGKCVTTGADGGFQISEATPVGTDTPELKAAGFAARLSGVELALQSPFALRGSLAWLDAAGRALSPAVAADIGQGDNRVTLPEVRGAGLRFLRLEAGGLSVTWKYALGSLGARPLGAGQVPALAKTASSGVKNPPDVALVVTKAGIHNTTYYPATEVETDAKVVVPVDGDEILFDGKNMDQWTGKPGDWTIENNALHGKGSVGQIFTKGDYGSFRLFVTSRVVVPELNNGQDHLGILYWGKRPGAGSYGNNGIQVQPPNGYMWSYGAGGNPSPTRVVPMPGWRYHLWHTSELLVNMQTGEGRYAIFGTEITKWKATGGTKPGTIGMQIHAATSTVEYKDIWIEKDPKEPGKLISVRK